LQVGEKGEVLKLLVKLDQPSFRQLAAQALQAGDGGLVGYAVQGLQEDGSSEAVKIMVDALETSPNSFTWSYLSNALAGAGTATARAALLKARDTGNAEKRNFAVNALRMLQQRSPGYQHVFQAHQLAQSQKYKEAVEQFDMAIQLDPNLSDAYAGRGHALLHLEKPAEAGKDFAKAFEHDPYNGLALTGLCLVMVMSDGKPDEAVKKLEEARSKFPNDPVFNYNAACVYGRSYEHVAKDEKGADRDKRLEQFKQAALADLKKSIELGFQDFALMKTDPDLKPFHELPEFQELAKPAADGVPAARLRRNAPVKAVRRP